MPSTPNESFFAASSSTARMSARLSRMLAATEHPHELSSLLMAEAVLPDVALGVGTSQRTRSHQKPEHHCEA